MQHTVDWTVDGYPDVSKLPTPPRGQEYKFKGEDFKFDGTKPKAIVELMDIDEVELARETLQDFKVGRVTLSEQELKDNIFKII